MMITGQAYTYAYDRFGNRWQQNGPHTMLLAFSGANNRMDGYSYDADGNVLNDGVHSYAYDAENRIVTVRRRRDDLRVRRQRAARAEDRRRDEHGLRLRSERARDFRNHWSGSVESRGGIRGWKSSGDVPRI